MPERKTRFEMQIPQPLMARVRKEASREETSAAWVVRRALEQYLRQTEPTAKAG